MANKVNALSKTGDKFIINRRLVKEYLGNDDYQRFMSYINILKMRDLENKNKTNKDKVEEVMHIAHGGKGDRS